MYSMFLFSEGNKNYRKHTKMQIGHVDYISIFRMRFWMEFPENSKQKWVKFQNDA